MTTKTQSKKPILAAILNVLVPGVGYLYVGVRKNFAWMLVAASIVSFVTLFDPNSFMYIGGETPAKMSALDTIVMVIVAAAFAYDAYMAAKQTQK